MRLVPILLLALLPPLARADALAGAWERFPTEENADAWNLYSYDDELVAPPLWSDTVADSNPYAFSFFIGGEGVWFFADEFTAGGAFVGDYASQAIAGIDVSIFVDPEDLDITDLAVYADGPVGPAYYFSGTYVAEDLGTEPDWYNLPFRFDDPWFYFDNGEFIAFTPTPGFLASISEVGLRVFPVAGVSDFAYVGIDDFILVPTVTAPDLFTGLSGNQFTLSFTPNPGVSASIEMLDPTLSWQTVDGQTGLTGPQTFSTPLDAARKLFRVRTEEHLTPVESF